MARRSYTFGPFHLDGMQGRLTRDGRPVAMGARAFAILEVLAERSPHVVDRQEILQRVWPGIFVEEAIVRVHMSGLRRALGDGNFIVNHPGRGYSLPAARVTEEPAAHRGVPEPASDLFGRDADLAALQTALATCRLVTVVGPGGIGKTSLALAVARDFAGGAGFVDLSPLSQPELVVSRVASTLGMGRGNAESAEALASVLPDSPYLLILDNCEQVLDGVAPLVELLQDRCRNLRLLATSRQPLRAEGESLHRLAPLALPPDAPDRLEEAQQASAMRLLTERAAALDPPCRIGPAELPHAIRLCRALDGLPLAIELAAARLGSLPIAELVQDLSRHLAPVEEGAPQSRHATLRATLDWSYRLLPPEQRSLLQRLGIFRGAFTTIGVEAAGSAGAGEAGGAEGAPLTPEAAREALPELIEKSLVIAELESELPSYRMLDTMQAYARQRLAEGDWHRHVALCHGGQVLGRLKDLAQPGVLPGSQRQFENRRLLDDLRGALEWCFSGGDASLGVNIAAHAGRFYMQMSMVGEFRRLAARALEVLASLPQPNPRAEMQLLGTLGTAIVHSEGPGMAVLHAHSRALALAERLGDLRARRRSLWGIWLHHLGQGHYAETLPFIEAYCRITPPDQDPWHAGARSTATSWAYLGDFAKARAIIEQVFASSMPQGSNVVGDFQYEPRSVTRALHARLLWLQGLADQARAAAEESLAETMASGHALSMCFSLVMGRCFIARMTGDIGTLRSGTELLERTAQKHGLAYWSRFAPIYGRAAQVMEGRLPAQDPAFLASQAWNHPHIELLAMFGMGDASRQGPGYFDRRGAIWLTPELERQAAACLIAGDPAVALARLDGAAALAARQGALSWELRIAISREACLRRMDRAEEGRRGVAAVLSRFTEGFDTADLVAAHRCLQPGETASGG